VHLFVELNDYILEIHLMNLYGFDFNLLKVLDALLTEGSTVGAARKVGLSQPAVSSSLNRLRHALGDLLFVRVGQKLEATDRAREMAAPVRAILEGTEMILSGPIRFDPGQASLAFKLSGSDYFAEMLMPELAKRLFQSAPGIRVQMVDLVPDNHIQTVEQYQVDLALTPLSSFPEWLAHQQVFRSAFAVVARERHPRLASAGVKPGNTIPVDLYCELPHILFSQEGKLRGMGDVALARIGRARHVAMTMPSFLGICRAVSESDMLALIPHALAERLSKKLNLSLYQPPMAVDLAEIHMIWHKRASNNPAHRWLRSLVADILRSSDFEAGQL
jgi:DNA-binding transcriptional LysR family regulator